MRVVVDTKSNETVNRLNKTRVEKTPEAFQEEREARDKQERELAKHTAKMQRQQQELEKKQHLEAKKLASYSSLFDTEKMTDNASRAISEDDFM